MTRKNHTQPANDNDPERKMRRCLMCKEEFDSSWAGERICRKCKSSATWRSGVAG